MHYFILIVFVFRCDFLFDFLVHVGPVVDDVGFDGLNINWVKVRQSHLTPYIVRELVEKKFRSGAR